MANQADGPAKGGSQNQTRQEQTSSVVTNARQVSATQGIGGVATVTKQEDAPSTGLYIEGLGNLDEVNDKVDLPTEDEQEGEGDYVVVLADYLSGNKGVGFRRGDVRRVSKIVPIFGDENNLGVARANAKRLFDGKAVRLATDDDIIRAGAIDPETNRPRGRVEVTALSNSSEVERARDAQIRAERERDMYAEKLRQLEAARGITPPTDPNTPDF